MTNIDTLLTYYIKLDEASKQKFSKEVSDFDKSARNKTEGSKKSSAETRKEVAGQGKLTQSVQKHMAVISEYEKIDKTGRLGQSERLKLIRTLTSAQASGVKLGEHATQSGKKLNTVLAEQTGAYTKLNSASQRTILTIMKWAVGWQLAYGALRAIQNAVRSVISDTMQLERQIYRAISASRFERGGAMPTGKEAGILKDIYTQELWNVVKETSIGIKDTGEALYFLSTAGLTARESLSALPSVIDLSVAAFGDLKEISRLVASSYNVFKDQLKDFKSTQEAMQYISDTIAYSYRSQQIEISELSAAMQFSAQMSGVMNVEFKDLVGTLGFLSSGLLRGTKGGTAMFNAFLQIADKSDVLRSKLGILFDERKEMDYIDLMTQLHNRFGDTAMSLEDVNLLFEVFGRRGGRAIAEILNRFDDWKQSIDITREGVKGMAEEMRDLIMESTIDKMNKLANASKRLIAAFTDTSVIRAFIDFWSSQINEMADKLEYLAQKQRIVAQWSTDEVWKNAGTWAATQEKWAIALVQLYDAIDRDVKRGFIPEDMAEKLKARAEMELKLLYLSGKAYGVKGVAMDDLIKIYKSLGEAGSEWILRQREANAAAEKGEPVNYALVQSFKALKREIELNNLQMIGLSVAQLSSKTISAKLSSIYSDLAENVANVNKNLKEGEKRIDLIGKDKFVEKITNIASAFQRAPEEGARMFEEFRDEMGKAGFSLSAISKILKDVAKQPLQYSLEAWGSKTREFDKALNDLQNNYGIQENILKTLGVTQETIAQNNIRAIETEIEIIKERNEAYLQQPHIAKLSLATKTNLPEVIKGQENLYAAERKLIKANSDLHIASYKEARNIQQEYFGETKRGFDARYKQQKLQLQIEGAGKKEFLELQRQYTEEEMVSVANEQTILNLFDTFNEKERKNLRLQLEKLGYGKEEISQKIKLYDTEKARSLELEKFTNQEKILGSLGYTDLEIIKMQLADLKKIGDITDDQREKLEGQLILKEQLAISSKKQEGIEREILYLETEVSNLPTLVQSYRLEESYKKRYEIALAENKEQEANNYLLEIRNLQNQRNIEQLKAAQEITGFISDSIYGVITGTKSWGDVINEINQSVLQKSIDMLSEMFLQKGIEKGIEKLFDITIDATPVITAETAAAEIREISAVAMATAIIEGATTSGIILKAAGASIAGQMIAGAKMSAIILGAAGILGGFAGGGGGEGVGAGTGDWVISGNAMGANGAIFQGGFREFSRGGTVGQPTLGLIGEGKYNEAIVPLPDGRKIPVDLKGQEQKRQEINIINAIDPSFISAAIAQQPNTIINIVNSDLLRNGMTRKSIRQGV